MDHPVFGANGDYLTLQGQEVGAGGRLRMFSKSSAGETDAAFEAYAKGQPGDANTEAIGLGYNGTLECYDLLVNQVGTGALHNLKIRMSSDVAMEIDTNLVGLLGHWL